MKKSDIEQFNLTVTQRREKLLDLFVQEKKTQWMIDDLSGNPDVDVNELARLNSLIMDIKRNITKTNFEFIKINLGIRQEIKTYCESYRPLEMETNEQGPLPPTDDDDTSGGGIEDGHDDNDGQPPNRPDPKVDDKDPKSKIKTVWTDPCDSEHWGVDWKDGTTTEYYKGKQLKDSDDMPLGCLVNPET